MGTDWREDLHPRGFGGRFAIVPSPYQRGALKGAGFESVPGGDEQAAHYESGGFVTGSFDERGHDAMQSYITGGMQGEGAGFGVNNRLRQGATLSPADEQHRQELRRAIDQHQLVDDTVLYRGVGFTPDWQEGDVIQDDGFMSISANPEVAWAGARKWARDGGGNMAVLQIETPAGTPIGWNADRSRQNRGTEAEFLFKDGSRIEVLSQRDASAEFSWPGGPKVSIFEARYVEEP